MKPREWKRAPTNWIRYDEGLRNFSPNPELAANIVALMCLTVIVQLADPDTGVARVTYIQFQEATGRSKALISKGLQVLKEHGCIVDRGRSIYAQTDYNAEKGWGKFPVRNLLRGEQIPFFYALNLRKRAELDALKLLFLFVAFRSDAINVASISYENIKKYTGIRGEHIKDALSLLSIHHIIHTESAPSTQSEFGVSNAYRVVGVDTRKHRGSTGRIAPT